MWFWLQRHERCRLVESSSLLRRAVVAKNAAGCPCMEALLGHCLKLRKWSLDRFGELKDVEGARVMGYLPMRAATWSRTSQREKCAANSKNGRTELSKPFDIWHQTWSYRIGNFPCWVLVLPLSNMFSLCPQCLPFGTVMHILYHCVLEVDDLLFDFTEFYR